MKKIVVLLAVFALDFILIDFVSASADFKILSPDMFTYLVMFLTLAMSLFLFYENHFRKAHEQWREYYQCKADRLFSNLETKRSMEKKKLHTPVVLHRPVEQPVQPGKKLAVKRQLVNKPRSKALHSSIMNPFKSKKPPSLDIQYEFIELAKNQIIEMRAAGRTEGEIIRSLKEQSWDPQVIFIALGRVKKRP